MENGEKVTPSTPGIKSIEYTDGKAVIVAGSGEYLFTTGNAPEGIAPATVTEETSADEKLYTTGGLPVVHSPEKGIYLSSKGKKIVKR